MTARADGLALCLCEREDSSRVAIILRHAGGEVFYELHPDRAENLAEGLLDLAERARGLNGDTIGKTEGAA